MPGRTARLTAPTLALLGLGLSAFGVIAEVAARLSGPDAAADLAVGLALFAAGLAMLPARPGWPALVAGVTWFAGDMIPELVSLHRGPLVQLLLTFPTGRARSRYALVVITSAYVDGAIPALAREEWLSIALAAALVAAAVHRYVRATGVGRRSRAAPVAGAFAIGGALALAAALRLGGVDAEAASLRLYEAAVALAALGLAADLRLGRWAHGAATGLVVDLGGGHELQALRAALARAVGDPGLEIAYRLAGGDDWVDESGRPVGPPGPESTVVERDGEPVAALTHDPAALADPELAAAVGAGVRLAVANVRLQAEMATRVREVEASRRRLVEAGDAERRRFGDELRTGPERRLAAVAERLERLGLAELLADLAGCRAELDRFAQGVHPRALESGGLRETMQVLAAHAAGPVAIDVPARRFPPAQEAAVYFLCSEALANVAKYAAGARASIAVRVAGGRLRVTVADDGPGGADPARGSGLRGLADRLEALGGSLRVRSAAGAGTSLEAELPIPEPR